MASITTWPRSGCRLCAAATPRRRNGLLASLFHAPAGTPASASSEVEPREMLADDFLCRIALDSLRAGIPVGHAPVRVEHKDGVVGHTFDQQTKPAARFRTRSVRAAPLFRHVAGDLGEADQPSPSRMMASTTTIAQKRLPSLRCRQPSAAKRPVSAATFNARSSAPLAF